MVRLWTLLALCATVSAQVGRWSTADAGEVVALDVDFKAYSASRDANELSFEELMTSVLAWPIRVTDIEPSSVGTVLVYFDVMMPTTTDYAPAGAALAVRDLFCGTTYVDVGTPACPVFLQAIRSAMPFVAGAYYNDQLTDSQWVDQAMPRPNITRAEVLVDMPLEAYAYSQEFYGRAFENAVEEALGATILVTDFQPTSDGVTRLFFDVVGEVRDIASLFESGQCAPCKAGDALRRAVQAQGLDAAVSMFI